MHTNTCKLIALLMLLFIQACNADPQADKKKKENSLAGYYIFGHEVNSFQPCGDKKVFWVIGDNDILMKLETTYANYSSKPYDEVFVKISGKFVGKASDGFAMDYDGQILVTKLFEMKKKSKTDCQ